MILINNEILLENTMDLNEFVESLIGQTYNEESRLITNCIVDFLYDVWERDEKLTQMIRKKISDNLRSIIVIDIEETADLTKTDIQAVSLDNDFVPKKADELAFNQFCERYFKGLKPLYNRFAELDLE